MNPQDIVTLLGPKELREAVNGYLQSNTIWEAANRDLVWSSRYVVSALAVLAGQSMTYGELLAKISAALGEASDQNVRLLTSDLMAAKMIASYVKVEPPPEPSTPQEGS